VIVNKQRGDITDINKSLKLDDRAFRDKLKDWLDQLNAYQNPEELVNLGFKISTSTLLVNLVNVLNLLSVPSQLTDVIDKNDYEAVFSKYVAWINKLEGNKSLSEKTKKNILDGDSIDSAIEKAEIELAVETAQTQAQELLVAVQTDIAEDAGAEVKETELSTIEEAQTFDDTQLAKYEDDEAKVTYKAKQMEMQDLLTKLAPMQVHLAQITDIIERNKYLNDVYNPQARSYNEAVKAVQEVFATLKEKKETK